PRFSVGKWDSTCSLWSPVGTAQGHYYAGTNSPYIISAKSSRALAPEATKKLVALNFRSVFIAGAIFAAALAPIALSAQQNKPWEKIPIPKLHEFKPHQP